MTSDGTLNSNTLTSTVTVTGVDQAPVLSNGGNTVNYTEGGAAAVIVMSAARARSSVLGRELVDGMGAERVIDAIREIADS